MRAIVIGAGVLGASTAYHLARAGTEVVVVDQAHEGRATAAGAGILCPWASDAGDRAFYDLYCGGARYYPELAAALAQDDEIELGYRRSGALVVSRDPAELDAFARMLEERRAAAPEMGLVQRLDAAATRALFPPLHPALRGVHIAGGARVDGRRLTAALIRAAQRHGAAVRQAPGTLRTEGGRVIGVDVPGERLHSDVVVVAAGAWAPALLRPLGIECGIRPMRGQIVHLVLPGQVTDHWPVVLPPGSHYLLAFEQSRIVVGATREADVGFDCRVTAAGQQEVLSEALRVAPGLRDATVLETRVGLRPAGPDVRPVLGSLHGIDGLLIGNGLGAAGLTIGPFAGRLLADAALRRTPSIDLTPFAPPPG
jgi:D-amino-acid dehydrogenase